MRRQGADRRGDDAHRRRPRNHGGGAHLDLVPAVAVTPRPRRELQAEVDAPATREHRARRRWSARLHPPGGARVAAAVSARVAAVAPHDRGRRARRLSRLRRAPMCCCSLYLLHRHPQFWSEPEAFRPERFAGAEPRSGTASPTCRSRPVRVTASARISRCSRCSCTCIPWCGASA